MKKLLLTLLLLLTLQVATAQSNPKREFRGAWIQCVNGQYLGKSPEQLREMLSSQLDVLKEAGINAIIFQCRAEGDALYQSSYEPWSRYLTGQQGVAPSDGWDPLQWMVDECHRRGMELHAWINPYRAKTKGTTQLAPSHAAQRHPDRIFTYGDLLIFNPALEQNRHYTCMVVEDILTHYDIDGLHMDDYFYPYPVAGQPIPDEADFRRDPRGFKDIADWRRDNVNRLVKDLHKLVRRVKPWVKFGISPFGIYRNSPNGQNCAAGSATKGTQNYDQLYADVQLWVKKGWVDYIIPQIYWNFGTKAADYGVLCHWWNDYCNDRPIFVGQDVERTVKEADPLHPERHQMEAKYDLQRSLRYLQGSCQWYAAAVVQNPGNYRTMLERRYHRTPALQPLMPFIDKKAPGKPSRPKIDLRGSDIYLTWTAPKWKREQDKPVQYVVYRFAPGERPDTDDPTRILGITTETELRLEGNLEEYTLLITALDRLHNESKPVRLKL